MVRSWVVRLLAVATAVFVAAAMVIGWHDTDADRAKTLHGARARLAVDDGRMKFAVAAVPEGFLQYAADRIPPEDPVEYAPADLALCGSRPQRSYWWGRFLWTQYRLAPRVMVCGEDAKWRIYLGAVPADVPAADRWSDSFAVVALHQG